MQCRCKAQSRACHAIWSLAYQSVLVLVRFWLHARLMPDSNISASRRRLLSPSSRPLHLHSPISSLSPLFYFSSSWDHGPHWLQGSSSVVLCTEYRLGNAHSLFRAILPPCLIHRDGHDP
ncbi:hypothetical protein M431DRAFT_439243 [Trichoderma harzianum CBS 226.95]|uniref:Uncharacterized protein n=1 Tax=Trichoderma harzianum CBS 226.95 TaxID=983964 RepID=A0A2T4ADS0_TRIHA|nr:hypothetical protein M431DRAFT_439243 [Trichoderma harzianum CBS 226.95]PTB55219.1 hypothetical protein M431DRAFT_439243 [Trichoderma harzianum CBS 226.95]